MSESCTRTDFLGIAKTPEGLEDLSKLGRFRKALKEAGISPAQTRRIAALVNPEITTKFWFTKSSGRLEQGSRVRWEWEMYGASTNVEVKAMERNKRILIEWDGYSGPEKVEWTFTPHGKDATFVSVTDSGFRGTEDEIVKQALESTGGFTWLLAGLKAYLEYGVRLNLVADAHPKGVGTGQK